ncbi:MAG: hypothetical protein ACOY5F_14430 [Pseudomonadota bacterium]
MDDDRIRLAVALNVATNGRLFCALLVLANIAAGNHALAVVSAAPVGLSCLVDQLPSGSKRTVAAMAVYALAIGIGFASLLNAR